MIPLAKNHPLASVVFGEELDQTRFSLHTEQSLDGTWKWWTSWNRSTQYSTQFVGMSPSLAQLPHSVPANESGTAARAVQPGRNQDEALVRARAALDTWIEQSESYRLLEARRLATHVTESY